MGKESHIQWAIYCVDNYDYYVSLNKGTLEKIKEAKKFCEDYLSLLMNDMSIKETSKKNLLKIEEFIFLSEINKFKKRISLMLE